MTDDLPRRDGYLRVPCPGVGYPRIMPEGYCRACGREVGPDDEGNAVEHRRYEAVRCKR